MFDGLDTLVCWRNNGYHACLAVGWLMKLVLAAVAVSLIPR